MAKVLFKRKTTDEIKELEIQDGALIYNTDNGKTYMDFGEERIQTGGNADTMITIGGQEAPTDTDIKIWIKDKDNQNYNNFYYRNADNKFEQMFLQPTGDTLPIGSISAYGGENIPTNWLKCNGQAVSRADYPELFNTIGTTYGSGDGSTTFNLPNISERVIVGNNGDGEFSLGNTGGEKEHTLTINEMPSHTHLYRTSVGAGNAEGTLNMGDLTGGVITGTYGNAIQNTGGSQAHNNMQPYIALNYIIKAKQSVGIVGTVTSDINDTNDNAVPNAKTVKDYVEEVYSTDEVKTNKIWIDGKPIYRKKINFSKILSSSTDTPFTVSMGLSDVDTMINFYGVYNDLDTSLIKYKCVLGNYIVNGVSYNSSVYFDKSKNAILAWFSGSSRGVDGFVIAEYTKTTD